MSKIGALWGIENEIAKADRGKLIVNSSTYSLIEVEEVYLNEKNWKPSDT